MRFGALPRNGVIADESVVKPGLLLILESILEGGENEELVFKDSSGRIGVRRASGPGSWCWPGGRGGF